MKKLITLTSGLILSLSLSSGVFAKDQSPSTLEMLAKTESRTLPLISIFEILEQETIIFGCMFHKNLDSEKPEGSTMYNLYCGSNAYTFALVNEKQTVNLSTENNNLVITTDNDEDYYNELRLVINKESNTISEFVLNGVTCEEADY